MGVFKRAVFQFGQSAVRRTWSEVLYHGNQGSTLDQVRKNAEALLALRSKMLMRGVQILNAYVSDDDFVRDSMPVAIPEPDVNGDWNKSLVPAVNTKEAADFPWTTELLRMRSGTRTTKSMFISGVPDADTSALVPDQTLGGLWEKAYDAWAKALKDVWGWKGIQTASDVNPLNKIKDIVNDVNEVTIQTTAAHGIQALDQVYVSKAKFSTGNVKGIYKVTAVPAPDKLTVQKKALGLVSHERDGIVQKRSFTVLTIEEVIRRGVTEKKRGDSVGRRVGRRKTRK